MIRDSKSHENFGTSSENSTAGKPLREQHNTLLVQNKEPVASVTGDGVIGTMGKLKNAHDCHFLKTRVCKTCPDKSMWEQTKDFHHGRSSGAQSCLDAAAGMQSQE